MAKGKEKRKPDERIEKESNQLVGKLFYAVCGLLIASIAVKCYFKLPFYVYALEIVSLAAGIACFLIREMRDGILFIVNRDAILKELHRKAQTKALAVQFWLMVVGCVPVILCAYIEPLEQYFWWFVVYFLIMIPAALIITVATLKKGWLVWGSKKQEAVGKKRLVLSAVLAGVIYVVLMEAFDGFKNLYHDGAFHVEGVLWIVGVGTLFGVLYYFVMLAFFKISEKNANKRLKEVGAETEEQGGVSNEE